MTRPLRDESPGLRACSPPIHRSEFPLGRYPTFQLHRPHRRLQRLQEWVAIHGAFDLTLKAASRIAGLELHRLSSVFHRSVGQTFQEWTREQRVAHAIQALERGDRTVEQVARLVGYQDRSALERNVKRVTGSTPREVQGRAFVKRQLGETRGGKSRGVLKRSQVPGRSVF
jgi:AraC-like DNA-binding protein